MSFSHPIFNTPWLYDLPLEAWAKAFDLAEVVLRRLALKADDPRLAITFRQDSTERFVVVFGGKYAGGFYQENGQVFLRFVVAGDFDLGIDDRLLDLEEPFKDGQTRLVYMALEDWQGINDPFLVEVVNGARLALSRAGRSNQRKHHVDMLYDVIMDPNARKEWMDWIVLSPQERIIAAHKSNLRESGNKEEWYKWELAARFQQHWDLEAPDFGEMLSRLDFSNLLYNQSISFINEARVHPEEARAYYRALFDESVPLDDRLKQCKQHGDALIQAWHPGWKNAGQDERCLSVFLSFHDLEHYAPYKASFYVAYCRYLGISPKRAGLRYGHYLELVNDLVANYITRDEELIRFYQEAISGNEAYARDPQHHLLAQNILYTVFDQLWNTSPEDDSEETFAPDIVPKEEPMHDSPVLNQILYGPPGTGKTWRTIRQSVAIVDPDYFQKHKDEPDNQAIKKRFDELLIRPDDGGKGRIAFTTFHQSMSYEDFVEGIKPEAIDGQITYAIKQGIFRQICDLAEAKKFILNFDSHYDEWIVEIQESEGLDLVTHKLKKPFHVDVNAAGSFVVTPKNGAISSQVISRDRFRKYIYSGQIQRSRSYLTPIAEEFRRKFSLVEEPKTYDRFVLIIDEINRGNVAGIFGELITLLEPDKRAGARNELTITLPYSRDVFQVPANLYVIGTMNTADRSVEALDAALRRRFHFSEMPPKPRLLAGKFIGEYSLEAILSRINERLLWLKDMDHTIGHAWFMEQDAPGWKEIRNVFRDKIIPLLHEYFFGDPGLIGLVLGPGFVKRLEMPGQSPFASFDHPGRDLVHDKVRYTVIMPENEEEMTRAIHQLMSN